MTTGAAAGCGLRGSGAATATCATAAGSTATGAASLLSPSSMRASPPASEPPAEGSNMNRTLRRRGVGASSEPLGAVARIGSPAIPTCNTGGPATTGTNPRFAVAKAAPPSPPSTSVGNRDDRRALRTGTAVKPLPPRGGAAGRAASEPAKAGTAAKRSADTSSEIRGRLSSAPRDPLSVTKNGLLSLDEPAESGQATGAASFDTRRQQHETPPLIC